jgi:putative transcriptional regulator
MQRAELIDSVRTILTRAGFYVSELCSIRPVGFDLVARRDNSLLIIKVLSNVDALSEEVARELRVLSSLLRGSPLLIGDRSGLRLLETDVVYDRFGLPTISPETLHHHLLDGLQLTVYAAPGGFYVKLDTEKLIRLRREANLSLGLFARSVKVSRRMVRMYEDGMNARVEVAIRIEDMLGEPISIPLDVLQPKQSSQETVSSSEGDLGSLQNFQRQIFTILREVGYQIIPMERCPFEAVSKDKDKILLTCVHKYDNKLKKKAHVINSISKITEKHAVLFIDKETTKTSIEGTPLIIRRELKNLRSPEDILELILGRIS